VPAANIEAAVVDRLRGIFQQPQIIVGTWRTSVIWNAAILAQRC
jgi:hypothetical protein